MRRFLKILFNTTVIALVGISITSCEKPQTDIQDAQVEQSQDYDFFHNGAEKTWRVYKNDTSRDIGVTMAQWKNRTPFVKGDRLRIISNEEGIFLISDGDQDSNAPRFSVHEDRIPLTTGVNSVKKRLCAAQVFTIDGEDHYVIIEIKDDGRTITLDYSGLKESPPSCSNFEMHGGRAHAEN